MDDDTEPRGVAIQTSADGQRKCYYSGLFVDVASHYGVQLRKTRPFRPQTNGKAEAYIKTLQREWAYRRPYTSNHERLEALETFLVDYNFARPHTAIGNQPPASRL